MKTAIDERSDLARVGAFAAGIGLVLFCAIPIVAWIRAGADPHPVSLWGTAAGRRLVLTAFVPYLVALALLARGRLARRTVLWLGALMYALIFVPPIITSHDIVSYLFYGKMAARGHLDPLIAQPAAFSADPWFRYVGWKHAPSVYGPIWTFVSAAAGALTGWRLTPAMYLLKAMAVGGVVVAALLGSRMSGTDPRRRDWVLAAILWNPLIIFSAAGDGHVDGILAGLVVAAAFLRTRRRLAGTTVVLIAASLIKPYCLVLLGVHALDALRDRERRIFATSVAFSLVASAAAYSPFWRGLRTFTALAAAGSHFTATLPNAARDLLDDGLAAHGVRPVVAGEAGVDFARALSLIAFVVALTVIVRWRQTPLVLRWALAFGAYIVCAPWFLPWHAIPFIVLALVATDAEGEPALRWTALTLAATSLVSSALVRFGVPAAVLWIELRRAGAEAGSVIQVATSANIDS